jgi:hypothetical protein
MKPRFLLFLFLLLPGLAAADDASLRAGAYLDAESAFVGGDLRLDLGPHFRLAPNLEWIFPENTTYVAFGLDLHYDFRGQGRARAWLGAGLGLYYANPEGPGDGDTDLGANFVGGVGLKGSVTPYVQLKVVVKGDTEVVVAFGLRFSGI